MRYWLLKIRGWIPYILSKKTHISSLFKGILVAVTITISSASLAYAQTEDTTQTPREFPEEQGSEQTRDPNEAPYQMDILRSDIERYQLNDYGSTHRFYRQLKYKSAEEFLMSEEEGYNRYGAEWERKINEDLLTILRATFKEDSEIMKLWKSIAPFLSFGIWEPYEVPITRVAYPEKVPAESIEE